MEYPISNKECPISKWDALWGNDALPKGGITLSFRETRSCVIRLKKAGNKKNEKNVVLDVDIGMGFR